MKAELSRISIVMLGSFNPKIFQPAWFAANELIRKLEAEEAGIEIIHNDISIFSIGDWLRLAVTRDRFDASTEQEAYFEVLVDFVLGTFSLLSHTPAGILGINTSMHYRVKNDKCWHEIGDKLAPKKPWNLLMRDPGLTSVEMQDIRVDGPKGYLRVRVGPSTRITPGIFISTNNHYEIDDPKNTKGCSELMEILNTNWKSSVHGVGDIAKTIIG
ncbi:MAG: hypothetical protein U9R17_09515 [Thermodesulfobacteriota bacterium]|nr:hypothetical protein [Thermodesulfobacteriota bacterium]